MFAAVMLSAMCSLTVANPVHETKKVNDGSKQISEINVLLPLSTCHDCRRVQYELTATNGCYKWEISHPQILSMTPKSRNGDCVETVILEPATLKDHKNLIWITAKDQNSGQVLRCEAKVSKIDTISIQSHYRQLYVNNNQHLHVTGYDEEGNVFSSLDGLRFDWSISKGADKIKRIQMSQYSKHSDTYFVKGTEAGQATVNVKIVEPGYEQVKDSFIPVTVVEPFVLIPQQPVFVAPTSEFQFAIAHLHMDDEGITQHPIKIPSKQYFWNVDNSKIGFIGEDGMFLSRVTEGAAEIVVVDQKMENNTAEGVINVVYPYRLEVKLRDVTNRQTFVEEHGAAEGANLLEAFSFASTLFSLDDEDNLSSASDSHILIEEHVYHVEMILFDKDNNLITLTDNLRFESSHLDPNYVEVLKKNDNGSKFVFKTKTISNEQKKLQTVHKLAEIRSKSTSEVFKALDVARLTVDKELVITKPVKIQHPTDLILLPFLPNSVEGFGSGEIWNTHAIGGSGIYSWSITDSEVASVQGSAQVRSLSVGKTTLFVKDHKNFKNWDSIEVEVAVVHELAWIEEQVELRAMKDANLQDGEQRVLSLYGRDIQGRKFSNCTAISPSISLKGNEGILDLVQDELTTQTKYDQVRDYVSSVDQRDLLNLKQRFDEDKNAILSSEIQHTEPKLAQELMFYNNFGICAQQAVRGQSEGLARIKASTQVFAFLNGPGRLLESEFAEVAVYSKLKTVGPKHQAYLSDLYSVNQLGQEFQSFESFYDDSLLNLNYGTKVTWTVVGGTNFWQDYAEKYQTSWSIEPLSQSQQKATKGDALVAVSKSLEQTTQFYMNVQCLTPPKAQLDDSYRAFVHLNQSSQCSRHLLRPASHHTKIEVNCEPPRHVRLQWSQQNRTEQVHQRSAYDALPRSRLVKNERTHYVLVNSDHFLRHLVFDQEWQVSLNHSSIATTVESTDAKMAQIYLANGQSYANDVERAVYDKRRVQFYNQTGSVHLKVTSKAYFSDILNNKDNVSAKSQPDTFSLTGKGSGSHQQQVKGDYEWSVSGSQTAFPNNQDGLTDKMRIEVVRNVDIEPKYKSLYIGSRAQAYKLKLLHGSGHFTVTLNDTSLAEIQHKDRDVYVYPKAVGGLEVKVEDLEVPEAESASAEVLISDIARLTLWSPRTLIEQGDEMDLTVSAFDTHGVEFDADQYAFMNFYIETEMTGVLRQQGLGTLPDLRDNRRFKAHGKEPGIYQLTAYTHKVVYGSQLKAQDRDASRSSQTIVSEMLRLEVFPLLEILPKQLLITPNMRYTLQIVGGPQSTSQAQQLDGSHIEIKFEIEETDIASVDQHREVTGHRVGDATLKYEIVQLRSQHHNSHLNEAPMQQVSKVVSKKTVPIRVRLVTDIEIPYAHQRQVYSGSFIKLSAVLKYEHEYFHHGIAPISSSWNCTQARVLRLSLPSKQELAATHGIASNFVMTTRTMRNNLANDNHASFFTAFNSTSVYGTAEKDGDAVVTVQLAIEYPSEYNKKQNWFTVSATVKVTEKLSINVPQYSLQSEQQTHLYLLPPNTKSKIETNKQTRLKLGYSQQSVYDYSTQSYKYQESTSPIISLLGDEAIKTYDKYGKVTVIVEEGQAFSDQVVMLNVLIADIYSIATMTAYDALSLPLGSTLQLPIHFQNEHAHRFANNIEGLRVGTVLSHPRVVSVSLDHFNQTLTLTSQGSGDCNIMIYLEDHPHIFDIIRVRVSSIVKPLSPVLLHVGGEVDFRVQSTEDAVSGAQGGQAAEHSSQARWSSSDPSVLQINQSNGKAIGSAEGKAEILLSNHANAASIVNVARVSHGQIDQTGSLLISTDEGGSSTIMDSGELKVRVKLYLDKQSEELMPTVQFDGITLIRQNVGIRCESDQPDYVEALGEVSELEGYFCVMRYVHRAQTKGMPRFVKIFVTAFSQAPDQSSPLYVEQVTQFEVQLTSSIKVETRFKNGLKLNRAKRTESVLVFSSSDFTVVTDYQTPEESQLIKYQVTRADPNSNEYNLTVTVPNQVSHSFNVNLVLSHPFAKKTRTLPLYFSAEDTYVPRSSERRHGQEDVTFEDHGEPGGIYGWLAGSEDQEASIQNNLKSSSDRGVTPPQTYVNNEPKWSFTTYFIMLFVVVVVVLFVLIQLCNVDVVGYWYDYRSGRMRDARYGYRVGRSAHQPGNGNYSQQGIREPRGFRKVPLQGGRDSTQYTSFGGANSSMMSSDPNLRRQQSAKPQGVNLDRFDYSGGQRDRRSPVDRSRTSIYSNLDDNSRYY